MKNDFIENFTFFQMILKKKNHNTLRTEYDQSEKAGAAFIWREKYSRNGI